VGREVTKVVNEEKARTVVEERREVESAGAVLITPTVVGEHAIDITVGNTRHVN
jgi:hypothetical protein